MNILSAVAVLAGLGGLFGLALAYASGVFFVKTDAREERISEVLPGINCGGCGFAGCGGCAEAIAAGRAAVTACIPGGSETAAKVAGIMGVEAEAQELRVAFVRCAGGSLGQKYEYTGVKDCLAATLTGSSAGPQLCEQGCLGFGSCAAACRFGALRVENGAAVVDADLCTGCGQCVSACPKKLIDMIPYRAAVTAPCSGCEKGSVTRKRCASGCIGCGKCEKLCKHGAVRIIGGHPVIDYAKCVGCGECVGACPRQLLRTTPRFRS